MNRIAWYVISPLQSRHQAMWYSAGHRRSVFILFRLLSFLLVLAFGTLMGCQSSQTLSRTTVAFSTRESRPAPTVIVVRSPAAPSPTVAPTPTATPEPETPSAPSFDLAEQAAAMRPQNQQDLQGLELLPYYLIDVTIDFDNLTYTGRELVRFINTERMPLDRLMFRLLPNGGKAYGNGSLTVSQVLVNQQPAESTLTLEDTVLQVRLPAILQRGEAIELMLTFEGQVPRAFGEIGGDIGYGIFNYDQQVMSLADWYPILAVFDDEGWNLDPPSDTGDSVYADMAFYSVDITTRKDVIVTATGVQQAMQEAGTQVRRRFVSGPAREFYMALSPRFQVATDEADGVRVYSYYLPGHEAGGQAALELAMDALAVFNQRFGAYPYNELDVVDVPMRYAAGVEFPGIILVNSSLYDEPGSPIFGIVLSHEVAHQWWYNVVGNDVIDEPWLDEALTTYSSAIFFEAVNDAEALSSIQQFWEREYNQALQRGRDDLITQPLSYWEQPGNQAYYGPIVYNKGALFFQALREEIGDDAFFAALQKYYTEKKYKIATPDDLLNAFEEAAGRSLDDFYTTWLYSAKS